VLVALPAAQVHTARRRRTRATARSTTPRPITRPRAPSAGAARAAVTPCLPWLVLAVSYGDRRAVAVRWSTA